MAFYQKKNNVKSTIDMPSSGLSLSATSLILSDGSKFPSSGNFLVTIWNSLYYPDPGDDSNMEIVKCTARSGNTLTIVRAQEDTTAVAHGHGEAVEMLITAGHFTEIEDAILSESIWDRNDTTDTITTETTNDNIDFGSGNITTSGTITGASLNIIGISKLPSITGSGTVSFNSQRLINLSAPSSNQDAATKKYVDDAISVENLWNRDSSTNTLTSYTANDNIYLGSGKLTTLGTISGASIVGTGVLSKNTTFGDVAGGNYFTISELDYGVFGKVPMINPTATFVFGNYGGFYGSILAASTTTAAILVAADDLSGYGQIQWVKGDSNFEFGVGGTIYVNLNTTSWFPEGDNNFDLGISSTNRWNNAYINNVRLGTALYCEADSNTYIALASNSYTLYINGNSYLAVSASGTIYNAASQNIDWKFQDFNGNSALFIQGSDGKIGVGLSSPIVKFHQDSGTATATCHKFTAGTTTGQTTTDGFDIGIDTAGNAEIRQRENLPILFYTNNTYCGSIEKSGNWVISGSSLTTTGSINAGPITGSSIFTSDKIYLENISTYLDNNSGDIDVYTVVNKTIKLQTTVYDELPPTPITAAKLGSSAPTLATFVGNIEQYTFDATNDYVIGATEITHKYKEGTNIHPHIHWATNGSEVSATGVKWQLEYTIANMDATKTTGSSFSTAVTISTETAIPARTADRTHMYTDLTDISGSGSSFYLRIGSYICWKFNRIAAIATAPATDPFALAVGFHCQCDTIGSRTETVK